MILQPVANSIDIISAALDNKTITRTPAGNWIERVWRSSVQPLAVGDGAGVNP